MSEDNNKTVLESKCKPKTLTVIAGASKQEGRLWRRKEFHYTVEILGDPYEAKVEADKTATQWLDEWLNESSDEIVWEWRTGSHGKFELASERKNVNKPIFLELRNKLIAEGNSATIDDFYYWVFEDKKNIGRKRS